MYAERWMAHGLQKVICDFQNKLTVPSVTLSWKVQLDIMASKLMML